MKKRRYARKIIDKKTYYLSIILVVMLIIITIYWSDKLLNKTTIAVVSDNATDINNSKNNMNTENKKNEEISRSESNAESNSEVETEKPTEGKITDWNLILVNKNNSIPENYTVNLREVEYGHSVDERIADSLTNMLSDARKQGLNPVICSSYRTRQKQERLYKNKVNEYIWDGYNKETAEELASYWVAIPGTGEHQTGLAVDIVSNEYQILDEKQEQTKEQQWLMENSYKYGFILRYPTEKKEITMINYEPWHYRYVGVENATYIKEHNICLEEYIEYLKNLNNS